MMLIKLNKMENRTLKLLLAIAFVMTFITFASAAVTYAGVLVSPIAGQNYSTTMTVNISSQLVNSTDYQYNATLWCNSSGGASHYADATFGGMVKIVTITNKSTDTPGDRVEWLQIKDRTTAGITQYNSYNCSGYTDNGTDQEWSLGAATATKRITIDYTAPSCSISAAHKTMAYKNLQEVIFSVSDNVELLNHSVYINGPESQVTLDDLTDASRTWVLSSQDTKYVGDWLANVTAKDWSGNTCNAEATWKTYLGTSPVGAAPTGGISTQAIIGIGIAIVLAYFLFAKKK